MSHKSTAPGIPYRVKPRFKRSPCQWAARPCPANPFDVLARLSWKAVMRGPSEFGNMPFPTPRLIHRSGRSFRRSRRRPPQRKKDAMALYEHVIIARQDISPQQAEALNDTLKALIEAGGGTVAKIEYWGLRNLTYRIKKNRKGHYSLLALDAPSDAVKEMERQLSINEDVLRYMTVRVEELDLELSPVLARRDRDRGERSDRGERRGFDELQL